MYKLCIFAGTTEGRELVSLLSSQQVNLTACVATEYGETLLTPAENLTIRAGRMTEEEMTAFFQAEHFDLLVDATHPYAKVVTDNLFRACDAAGTEYLRVLREASHASGGIYAASISEAVDYLNTVDGNILLTTGSKELAGFTGIRNFADRVYARVLPMDSSLTACREAGVKPANIIAMQGPFSEELNISLLRFCGAKYLVTKDGGSAGGFGEKAVAAKAVGATLVIIGRPPQKAGLSLTDAISYLSQRFQLEQRPEVTIVGIGTGSDSGMTGEVRAAILRADCLIGARRMLNIAPDKPCLEAIAPQAICDLIHSHREYRKFAVVMSGDTGFFSGTKKLLPLLQDTQVTVLPGISSLATLCARLGTSYEDIKAVSLHGRSHDITQDVRRFPRVFTLVGGNRGINDLCSALISAGLGEVTISVGQRLGYPDEKITVGCARELESGCYDPLSVALIENPGADPVVTHGLCDEAFQRKTGEDGVVPMTKSEVRSVCLSKLQLTQHAVCWDIGAGTGSVSIEMALQCTGGHVYAVERKADALELLRENQTKFHADNMTIVSGTAPEACRELPAPTHVFIGGSAGNMADILSLAVKKNPAVRIVATAIALETVAELTGCMKAFPEAEVISMQVAKGRKAGPYHLMMGSNPVYIFTMGGAGK